MTFQEAARAWLKYKSRSVSRAAQIRYAALLDEILLPAIGDRDTASLTGETPVAGARAQKLMAEILAYVRREQNTPYDYWDRKSDLRILNVEEQRRLTAFLRDPLTPVHTGLLLSLYAGLRAGESCALRWEDVHDRHLHVHQRLCREKVNTEAGEGKTQLTAVELDTPRDVPFPAAFLPCLGEIRPSGFVVTGLHGGAVEPRFLDVKCKDALKKCGIEKANYETLRDTFAVRCIEAGVDILCLSEILGHASVDQTVRRYGASAGMDEKRREMEKISALLPY